MKRAQLRPLFNLPKRHRLFGKEVSMRSAPCPAVGGTATLRSAQSVFRDVHAAAKKRIGLYSRRRAANSVRLFIGLMGAFMPPFGLHVFFWRDFPESKREKVRDLYETHWSCEIFFVIIKFAVVLPFEKAALFQCQTSRRRRVYTTRRL